jgi:hypothetical protein
MEVGQGPNWGCSAKEKKEDEQSKEYESKSIYKHSESDNIHNLTWKCLCIITFHHGA